MFFILIMCRGEFPFSHNHSCWLLGQYKSKAKMDRQTSFMDSQASFLFALFLILVLGFKQRLNLKKLVHEVARIVIMLKLL
ncbi:hypothetical protein C0J08_15485 [Marinomonas sp. CT5]|nr:hypothetical protein C0J08_15485 [Marinomonas sp. CT5]